MSDKVKILLVGIGGYAATYVNPLLDGVRDDCEIVGCADPFPNSCKRLEEIKERGIPLFSDMKEFFEAGLKADLAVITTPINFHSAQIKLALANGCQVLCEKPLCGDIADIPSLIEARDAAGKYVAIGYQWSHADAILAMKKDIMDGLYGAPVLMKTLVLWPRGYRYYKRGSGWAGKLRAPNGDLILDSVANNATAHYLHNILFVLGDKVDAAAMPKKLDASLWRVNNIENYDTCSIEMEFENGGRGLFIVSHATDRNLNPVFDYQFEKGRIVFEEGEDKKIIRGILADGTEKIYGDPFANQVNKLWMAVDAVKEPSRKPVCGIETATPHTLCIAEVQKNEIHSFPADRVHENAKNDGLVVEGLTEALIAAYEKGEMWRGFEA